MAACASQGSIVDEFPPHHRQGANFCANRLNAFAAYDKAQGISGDLVTLGKPKSVSITGNYAYALSPATYTHKKHGKPISETGATFVAALQKIGGEWRITGWAWAAP